MLYSTLLLNTSKPFLLVSSSSSSRRAAFSSCSAAARDLQEVFYLRRRHSTATATATATATTTATASNNLVRNNITGTIRRTMSDFQAWRVEESKDGSGSFVGSEQTLSTAMTYGDDKGDDESSSSSSSNSNSVLIHVTHSSLNYKDALSASGNKGVTRKFPHTPGIDAAGTIVGGDDCDYDDGASVLVTGYDLGMSTDGGFGEYIRVPTKWIVTPNPFMTPSTSAAPCALSAARVAMVYGTAGLTAALSVQKLLIQGNAKPSDGKVIVTGATGSVGSVAVELLSKLGFDVVAISGKTGSERDALIEELGAREVLGREALAPTKKPMAGRPQYAHGIDTVGGSPLAEVLKQIRNGGSVTCCGNVAGLQIESMTVLPFILRGVQLLGVDSVQIPLEEKKAVWDKLATSWRCPNTEASAKDIGRHEIDDCLKAMLKGQSSGKIVLDHSLTKSTTTTTTTTVPRDSKL